jgi:outer membrane protein, heavy metal efflux system
MKIASSEPGGLPGSRPLFHPARAMERRSHRAASLLSALALIAACQHFEPVPLRPEAVAAELESRSLEDPGLRRFLEAGLGRSIEWPLGQWDLASLTLAALYYQPSLDLARARRDVAQSGIETAAARPNPTLSIAPEYASSAPSGISPWLAAVHLDWPIETAGKRGYRIAAAEGRASAARLDLTAQGWSVRGALRASLIDVAAANARVEELEREAAAQERLLALLEQRASAGALSQADLVPPRLDRIRTRADLAAARRQQGESRAGLAAALGLPARALEGVPIPFPLDPGPDDPASLESSEARRRALLGRADVLAALADYAASESTLQLQIARQYPDLHVGTGYQFDQGEDKWALGLFLDLPVLDRNRGPIAEAEAGRREAAARFEALQAQVIAEVDAAVATDRGAREQLDQGRALVAEQRESLERAEAAFRAGALDRVALRGAELELARSELALLDAQTAVQRALAQLEQAVQPPLALLDSVERAPESVAPGSGP